MQGNTATEEISLDNTAMIVEFPDALDTNGAVEDTLSQIFNEKVKYTSLKAITKKEAAIKFETPEEANKAVHAIKEKYGTRKLKIMIV